MRLGVCLVVVSLVLGLVSPPKAEAFALTTTAGVVALVGGFLAACGLPFLVKGMNESGLTESVGRLLQEYFTAENIEGSLLDWAGSVPLTVISGKLIIPRLLSQKLTAFAQWVAGKYGAQVGENVVYGVNDHYITLANGLRFNLCTGYASGRFLNAGTPILQADFPIVFSTGYSMEVRYVGDKDRIFYLDPQGQEVHSHIASFQSDSWPMYIGINGSYVYFLHPSLRTQSLFISFLFSGFDIGVPISVDESLSVDRAESVTIPGELAEGQDLALDVGAVEGMEIQEILQGILDAILAGDLAASAEAVEAQPEQPPEEDIKDIDGLGLPALGAALITRFPFSIPWDIAKGIQLLAAPAKAPYFEVDFFEPIADRVGGWQGSTKIVLDFSQFEILGQLSRWTSTVGFCLMLAGATKRFIWTA